MLRNSRTAALFATLVFATILAVGIIWLLQNDSVTRPESNRDLVRHDHDSGNARGAEANATGGRDESTGTDRPEPEDRDATAQSVGLSGVVRYPDNRPGSDGTVTCIPSNVRPLEVEGIHSRLYDTRCDEGGRFKLVGLPEAPVYTLMATSNHAYGEARVRFRDVPGARIQIVLRPVYYERIRFVDSEAGPVDVADLYIDLDRGEQLYHSHIASRSWELQRVRRLGFSHEDLEVENNEVLVVYSSVWQRTQVLDLPGYKPVRVPPAHRPVGDWPKRATVVLHEEPSDTEIRHSVQLPRVEYPEPWGDPEPRGDAALPGIVLRLRVGHETSVRVITEERSEFFAPRSAPLHVELEGSGRIGYTKRPDGDRIIVTPQLPPLAFVSISYKPERRRGEPRVWRYFLTDSKVPVTGRVVRPGLVRFGPLAEGEYSFARYPSGSDPKVSLADPANHLGPLRLSEGHNELEWR